MSTKKKMGRPLSSDEPLTHDMKVRVSETTFEQIKEISIKNGMTAAEFIREAINCSIKENEN